MIGMELSCSVCGEIFYGGMKQKICSNMCIERKKKEFYAAKRDAREVENDPTADGAHLILKGILVERGIESKALGESLGWTQSRMSRIVNNVKSIKLYEAVLICKELGLRLDDIIKY